MSVLFQALEVQRSNAAFYTLQLVKALRPKQWAKQVFVLACAPQALISEGIMVLPKLGVLVTIFCAVASAAYLVNDLKDIEADRKHPSKRYRPIAAGYVTVHTAVITALVLAVSALALSVIIGSFTLLYVVVAYIVISQVYNAGAKHTPVLDVVLIGSLYSIRTLAGFVAVAAYPAALLWVLLAGLLGVIVVLVKRKSEAQAIGNTTVTRKTLTFYAVEGRLNTFYKVVSGIVCVIFLPAAYALAPWFSITAALVAYACLRLWILVGQLAEDIHPQEIVRKDRPLCLVICMFVAAFFAAIAT